MRRVAWMFLPLLLGVACSDDAGVSDPSPGSTERPDEILLDREADEAALWLSGQLTAPHALYETIHDDLAAIRAGYGESIPVLNVLEFQPWWVTSTVLVQVTSALRDLVLAREPNPLDSLNTQYRAASMNSFTPAPSGWQTVIHFIGRRHPERLADIYRGAEGVMLADVDTWLGDYSNVYPWHIDGGMSYLFRHGLGDCPAGCEASDFYYFRRVGDSTEYVGSFRQPIDPYPAWWGEASAAFCAFMMQQWGWTVCPWAPAQ